MKSFWKSEDVRIGLATLIAYTIVFSVALLGCRKAFSADEETIITQADIVMAYQKGALDQLRAIQEFMLANCLGQDVVQIDMTDPNSGTTYSFYCTGLIMDGAPNVQK